MNSLPNTQAQRIGGTRQKTLSSLRHGVPATAFFASQPPKPLQLVEVAALGKAFDRPLPPVQSEGLFDCVCHGIARRRHCDMAAGGVLQAHPASAHVRNSTYRSS